MIDLEKHNRMANAIRVLSMDAVEQAKSGHPGLPMGMADVATVLFSKVMRYDPTLPSWADRDRFVLSAGHGSMLIYSLLYLLGYEDMTLDELKTFRQLGAKTAGHPEFGHAAGIETTTGPLGQGLANAVGMALAERVLNAEFGDQIVNHNTYVIAGDGCLMEGISQEAISLAGHLKLNKLIVLFDDNGITIDGAVSLSDSTDQTARFTASGWKVLSVDGHQPEEILSAIREAQASDVPTMIRCKTIIGYGAPTKGGTSKAHGAPLGPDEIAGARQALGWTDDPFEIPSDVRDVWRVTGLQQGLTRKEWERRLAAADPDLRAEFERRMRGDLPNAADKAIEVLKASLIAERQNIASRKASELALAALAPAVPELIGGSADLTGSNNTKVAGQDPITADNYKGKYVYWGIREHAMAAALNGMALHGGVVPYGGTFLVFSDYCRPSVRLAALMGLRVVFVFTHDSIGLGEDGPTHQPVEHLAALRAIPNLTVYRPADVIETAECWQLALHDTAGPSVIALSRQNLAQMRTTTESENLCAKGAYEIASAGEETAEVTLFASGSEVEIAVAAKKMLDDAGHATRVVSVPAMDTFLALDASDRSGVIGHSPVKIAIEAGIEMGWAPFIGSDGAFVGMSSFGASGKYKDLYEHFGITAERVAKLATDKIQALSNNT